MHLRKIDLLIWKLGHSFDHKLYSSIFRVFVGLLLIKETLELWVYVPILFQQNSFITADQRPLMGLSINVIGFMREYIFVFLGIYLGLLIFFLFGIGRHFTAFLVFIFYYFLEKLSPLILNGGDNLLGFLLLYLAFIDSYHYLSLSKKTYHNPNIIFFHNFVSSLFTFCICFHLVAVYLTTALHKIHSDVWFHGIAVYYTFQLDRFEGTSFNTIIAKNIYLVTLFTYFTVFVELLYPTLVWFKNTKKIIIPCAILMHIGIYIFMMIYDFQLIFILLQGFFFNDKEWVKIFDKLKYQIKKVNLEFIQSWT